MGPVLEKIEEFNIGREHKFRGQIENSTLYIVHNLDPKKLEKSKKAIKKASEFKKLELVSIDEIDKITSSDHNWDKLILTLHLGLDKEIYNHQFISQWAFDHGIYQLNPYNKIAKIFDDKYLFYVLMTANEIKQAHTKSIPRNNKVILADEIFDLQRFKKLVVKPRHGTEKRDCYILEAGDLNVNLEFVQNILKYDDCIIQEYIEHKSEFKVLYYQDRFYPDNKASKPGLKLFLDEFVDVLHNYAQRNEIIMPEIFSLDILEKENGELVLLEANIRPAKIWSFF